MTTQGPLDMLTASSATTTHPYFNTHRNDVDLPPITELLKETHLDQPQSRPQPSFYSQSHPYAECHGLVSSTTPEHNLAGLTPSSTIGERRMQDENTCSSFVADTSKQYSEFPPVPYTGYSMVEEERGLSSHNTHMQFHSSQQQQTSSKISHDSWERPKRRRATSQQLSELEQVFQRTLYPSTAERHELARRLGMTPRRVQIWFQNQRQKIAKKELDENAMRRLVGLDGVILKDEKTDGGHSGDATGSSAAEQATWQTSDNSSKSSVNLVNGTISEADRGLAGLSSHPGVGRARCASLSEITKSFKDPSTGATVLITPDGLPVRCESLRRKGKRPVTIYRPCIPNSSTTSVHKPKSGISDMGTLSPSSSPPMRWTGEASHSPTVSDPDVNSLRHQPYTIPRRRSRSSLEPGHVPPLSHLLRPHQGPYADAMETASFRSSASGSPTELYHGRTMETPLGEIGQYGNTSTASPIATSGRMALASSTERRHTFSEFRSMRGVTDYCTPYHSPPTKMVNHAESEALPSWSSQTHSAKHYNSDTCTDPSCQCNAGFGREFVARRVSDPSFMYSQPAPPSPPVHGYGETILPPATHYTHPGTQVTSSSDIHQTPYHIENRLSRSGSDPLSTTPRYTPTWMNQHDSTVCQCANCYAASSHIDQHDKYMYSTQQSCQYTNPAVYPAIAGHDRTQYGF